MHSLRNCRAIGFSIGLRCYGIGRAPFWREFPHKDASCVLNLRYYGASVLEVENEMFGCIVIRERNAFVQRAGADNDALGDGFAHNIDAGQCASLSVKFFRDRVKMLISDAHGDKHHLRVYAMLCL